MCGVFFFCQEEYRLVGKGGFLHACWWKGIGPISSFCIFPLSSGTPLTYTLLCPQPNNNMFAVWSAFPELLQMYSMMSTQVPAHMFYHVMLPSVSKHIYHLFCKTKALWPGCSATCNNDDWMLPEKTGPFRSDPRDFALQAPPSQGTRKYLI